MNIRKLMLNMAVVTLSIVAVSCSNVGNAPAISFKVQTAPPVPRTMEQMGREVNIERDYMAPRSRARRAARSLKPRFITIHSTANKTADARQHSRALKRGAMGRLNWHFTVDQNRAVQHIPLTETGRHADGGGPGDMYSIGIEMGEVRSHHPAKTWNRSAKLTAVLMKRYNIPLRNVVPHYYWTGKDCPHPLLNNGRPGYKWRWFISRVDYYRRCLDTKPAPRNGANAKNKKANR